MSQETINKLQNIMDIYSDSEGEIRPHFTLTGTTGSSKTYTMWALCEAMDIPIVEINCAQITDEGVTGNSISKELAKARSYEGGLCVIWFDEFDKLFLPRIDTDERPSSTQGVQNELLRVVEGQETSVYGNYGKYRGMDTSRFLFVFGGAFNGKEITTATELLEIGVRSEFVGRVPLVFHMEKMTLEALMQIMEQSELLENYLTMFEHYDPDKVINDCCQLLEQAYERNVFGARIVNGIIHQYFINNGDVSKVSLVPRKSNEAKGKSDNGQRKTLTKIQRKNR